MAWRSVCTPWRERLATFADYVRNAGPPRRAAHDPRMGVDLHQGFREPARAPAGELSRFLEDVDRLPGIRAIRAAMREAVALEPGTRLLDVGCGNGIETARLAEAHPRALVTGLDRNVELLRDAPRGPVWLEGDLLDPGLPAGSFDVVRTERVLMYVGDLHRALDALLRLLAPGGRLVLFELDYGATILAPSRLGNGVVGARRRAAGRLAPAAARRSRAPAAAGRARGPRRRRPAVHVRRQRAGLAADRLRHAGAARRSRVAGLPRRRAARAAARRVHRHPHRC